MTKFNVFLIHKAFCPRSQDAIIVEQWKNSIGKERILNIKTPKACIDVILGAIAITSGARTLETYVNDMIDRG